MLLDVPLDAQLIVYGKLASGRIFFFIFNLFLFYYKNNSSGQIFADLAILVAPGSVA